MRIEATDLCKSYGRDAGLAPALSHATFTVQSGEFVAIVGRSGSGKSTLMNLIGLLDRPSAGRLALDGLLVGGLSSDRLAKIRNESLGFVFQSYQLLPQHSALHNVELPLTYRRMPARRARKKALEMLELMGIGHRAHRRPCELSGGEQQRTAIARALVVDPKLILADEPTGALDSATGQMILETLRGLNRSGRTIVMVTHDPQVAAHASRTIRIHNGRIVEDDPECSTDPARPLAVRETERSLI